MLVVLKQRMLPIVFETCCADLGGKYMNSQYVLLRALYSAYLLLCLRRSPTVCTCQQILPADTPSVHLQRHPPALACQHSFRI
jgi:hypothetical protein